MTLKPVPNWLVCLILSVILTACGAGQELPTPTATALRPTPEPELTPTSSPPTAEPEPTPTAAPTDSPPPHVSGVWIDVTDTTIGETDGWTNKVELADVDGDGLVDLLFANGGDYDTPGEPELSQVFLNRGPGQPFEDATETVFGPEGMLARVIKVRDVNGDGHADVMVGTTFQTQSQLFLGEGGGQFSNVTASHLPQGAASIGDLEFGDVDGDGDLDVVLADWGAGSPMINEGGRTLLWLNDGAGRFTDETDGRIPDPLVRFSWELELVDVDNDYDLDILVSCKVCDGSFLFINDGAGQFSDVTADNLPQYPNNYDFEAMDLNGDGFLDLVTMNDGNIWDEHLFLNNGSGRFENATKDLWPAAENPGYDDNLAVFLDYDSDGDADFLIGSLNGPDRVMINDGAGRLTLLEDLFVGVGTPTTLGIAVADLNGDGKLDVVQGQGESPLILEERVYFGQDIRPDSAPPLISMIQHSASDDGTTIIRARIHDNKRPTMPHDWQSVIVRWTAGGQTNETPLQWYGEYLWRAVVETADDASYEVCATDAAGNEACAQ